jgi:integrative and conjugative element protein (TIGR02256 family)
MKFDQDYSLRIEIPRAALTEIYDECDRYDIDETGGRVLGTFTESHGQLTLHVSGIIEPGPAARRSQTSFFQDGEHQERVFRQIEETNPEIEHLGNWHTHHVNGLQHLSGGDIPTYRRIVNHQKHNVPFFYALLVVGKNDSADPLHRYAIKHYLFRRGDEHVYEIPPNHVKVTDGKLVWPAPAEPEAALLRHTRDEYQRHAIPSHQRVYDRDIIAEFYPKVRPFTSPKVGFYWRGTIELVDESFLEAVVTEDVGQTSPAYSVHLRGAPDSLSDLAEKLAEREFPSARAALLVAERVCNQQLYLGRKKHRKSGD